MDANSGPPPTPEVSAIKNHTLGAEGGRGKRRSISLGFLLVLIAVGFAANPVNGSDELRSAITVRIYDYAQVQRRTLHDSEFSAANILRKAGIETTWIQCPIDAAGVDVPLNCQQTMGPAVIVLRILPRFASGRGLCRAGALGFSVVPAGNESGTYAGIFFDRVETVAKVGAVSPAEILGHVTAHEIGHLLLRSNQHSMVGIMRAQWNEEDLRHASQGCLVFTAQQSRLIHAEVARRNRMQQADALSETAGAR